MAHSLHYVPKSGRCAALLMTAYQGSGFSKAVLCFSTLLLSSLDSPQEGAGSELLVPQGMRARAMLSVHMIWFREI